MDVSLITSAFVAGLLSFLSPCVLPLVPPYLCYMAGITMEELDAGRTGGASRPRILPSAVAFVLGFSTVFIALGASASTIGRLLSAWSAELSIVAGLVIIVMGLHFMGLLRVGALYREHRFQAGGASLPGAFVMGLAFAFGWTPCIGPVLGTILTLAGSRQSLGEGAGLLAVYSAGLGVPFLLAAAFVTPFLGFFGRMKRHVGLVERAMGVALVLTGIAFLTGSVQAFSFWLLETFPGLARLG